MLLMVMLIVLVAATIVGLIAAFHVTKTSGRLPRWKASRLAGPKSNVRELVDLLDTIRIPSPASAVLTPAYAISQCDDIHKTLQICRELIKEETVGPQLNDLLSLFALRYKELVAEGLGTERDFAVLHAAIFRLSKDLRMMAPLLVIPPGGPALERTGHG